MNNHHVIRTFSDNFNCTVSVDGEIHKFGPSDCDSVANWSYWFAKGALYTLLKVYGPGSVERVGF